MALRLTEDFMVQVPLFIIVRRQLERKKESQKEREIRTHLNLSSMALRVVEVFMVQLPSFSVISMTGVEAVAA